MEDRVGRETLETISAAKNFNQWMYETIKPFAKGKVLEIGSGIGNISDLFLRDGYNVMLSDYNSGYCDLLKERYSTSSNVLGVQQIDLVENSFAANYSHLLNSFDTVFALNVIEHIENDQLAIANSYKLLKPGGHLIILVPSYQRLYNSFDKELGHYKRYDIPGMSEIFQRNHLEIIHTQYFNFAGILGWYLNGNILKKQDLPEGQMMIYNKLVPVFKMVDKVVQNRTGLSTIVVGRKNS